MSNLRDMIEKAAAQGSSSGTAPSVDSVSSQSLKTAAKSGIVY